MQKVPYFGFCSLLTSLWNSMMPASQLARRFMRGVHVPRVVAPIAPRKAQMNFYSTQKNTEKAEKKPQSILTDDLLAKAGFEEETPEKEDKSDPEGSERSSRRRRRNQTSKDKQREKYANWFYILALVGGVSGLGYMSRDWDSAAEQQRLDGEAVANGFGPSDMYNRMSKRMGSLFTFFSEPVFENLLPPPAPEAYRRPLTLVLTLDDLLIHSSWDSKNGWRTAKRPGLDYFLGYLSQYYEIVLFGTNSQMYSEATVRKLDPLNAYISFALYREGCRYKDGKLIKDLSLLNRDLAKTVIIDVNAEQVLLQEENSIVLQPWEGVPDDKLVRLISFLEYLATSPVKDVRPILATFNDKSQIVEEFEVREQKLREKWMQDNKHLFNRPNAASFLATLTGTRPSSLASSGPKMPLDIIREHGKMQYEHFQKYLKENAAKFLEEEQKLKEEFGKVTLNKLLTEGPPTAEDVARVQAERAAKEKDGN